MSRPFCKKCFFSEIDRNGIYKDISELIAALPSERRTDETEYRRRLKICGECDFLGEGTCGKCGCFVELRAAKKDMHCPSEEHLW
ncbi:MAG: DUF6171 family protein [Oscillospiraceae bacterium]